MAIQSWSFLMTLLHQVTHFKVTAESRERALSVSFGHVQTLIIGPCLDHGKHCLDLSRCLKIAFDRFDKINRSCMA